MESVEIFKTNVQEQVEAEQLVTILQSHFPHYKVNFDLHDCDRILRVAALQVCPISVEEAVRNAGYQCSHII